MKIPDTSANVGAYYGNEENGQWQPNGVIIDNGVGGGVVGSGDAGLHRPPVYPIHIPRGHMPGYVMAGAYYPPAYPPVPQPQDDFEDYMWMENEEEFDKQVMQQLEEEALMEQCIEAMLEDEQRERHHRPVANGHNNPTTSNGSTVSLEEAVSKSTLNPLAAEFVPTCARLPPPIEDKKEPPPESKVPSEEQRTEDTIDTEEKVEPSQVVEDIKIEEPVTTEPPEVSAAGVPTETKRPKEVKDVKKPEIKKSVKPEPKKVKSETKAQKKEVKAVKSEMVEDQEVTVELKPQPQTQPQPQASPPPEECQPQTLEFKPINYAAAAKANKPKRAPSPPSILTKMEKAKTDKPKTEKMEKKEKVTPKPKTEKPRKNSAK